jgi:hypothetical protein
MNEKKKLFSELSLLFLGQRMMKLQRRVDFEKLFDERWDRGAVWDVRGQMFVEGATRVFCFERKGTGRVEFKMGSGWMFSKEQTSTFSNLLAISQLKKLTKFSKAIPIIMQDSQNQYSPRFQWNLIDDH